MKKLFGFTLVDLLIVIAVIAIVLTIAVMIINPVKMIAKSHDAQRLSDTTELATTLNLYLADNKKFDGFVGPYLSTEGNEKNRININGTGWLPLKFNTISSGALFEKLPIDPLNNVQYHYSVGINVLNGTYEINSVFETAENIDKMSSDGGNNSEVFELGTDLTILP